MNGKLDQTSSLGTGEELRILVGYWTRWLNVMPALGDRTKDVIAILKKVETLGASF